ncbi:protein of unknown function [Microbacterium sp. Nx66]|nr:protein of unknown function [Microbacterium sp. Nx66]
MWLPRCLSARPCAEGHRSSARAQSVVTVSAARGERVIGRRGEPSSESTGSYRWLLQVAAAVEVPRGGVDRQEGHPLGEATAGGASVPRFLCRLKRTWCHQSCQ